jgi:hypothetical protein
MTVWHAAVKMSNEDLCVDVERTLGHNSKWGKKQAIEQHTW